MKRAAAAAISLMTGLAMLTGCSRAEVEETIQPLVADAIEESDSEAEAVKEEDESPLIPEIDTDIKIHAGSRIAVVSKCVKGEYWKMVKKGMEDAVKEINKAYGYKKDDQITMTFEGPDNEEDVETQINTIDAVIAENPDVLCISASDMDSCEAQLEAAKENGIPVIAFDSNVAEKKLVKAYRGTDNVQVGKMAAYQLGSALGKMGKVAVFSAQQKTKSVQDRVEGFMNNIGKYGDIEVVGIAAGRNIDALESQIREFSPKICGVWDEEKAKELAVRVADTGTKIVSGMEGLLEIAVMEGYEILVTAVVGMIGIRPTMAAIEAGKDIALANKETLVTAGHLIIPLVKEKKVRLLPVDSEHSAIFQCLNGEHGNKIEKILLTASGGPFRGWTREQMKNVQVEDALKHPNWSMGAKITIDSSTMVNKGLEVMEAKWLFDVGMDDVQVVVQPKSVIHSMVQFEDGAVMAQLGTPDMKLPIQYALYYPERRPMRGDRLDFWSMKEIVFDKPDYENFRGLALARDAGKAGGSVPVVFNAANEFAVAKFLGKKISYLEITDMSEAAMEHHKKIAHPSLDEVLDAEAETYEFLKKQWNF